VDGKRTAEKKVHIAVIKIIAILFVVFNHTGKGGFMLFSVSEQSAFFPFYLFISILCKIAVPLFFMCSGALLLGKDETYKTLFTKRILRYIIVIVVFSFLVYLYDYRNDISKADFSSFFPLIYSSQIWVYWFLYAYLAFLLMMPLLRKFARAMDGRTIAYFIALKVIFFGVIPALEYCVNRRALQINIALWLINDNIFYPIVGYWIENSLDVRKIRPRHLAWGVLAALCCIAVTCFLTVYKKSFDGYYSDEISQYFHNFFIAIPTIVVYVLVKRAFVQATLSEALRLLYLGGLTFGVYLLHAVILDFLRPMYNALQPYLRSLPSTLIWMLVTVAISGALTATLKRVPHISKLL